MKYHKVLINSIIILLIVLMSGCQNSQTNRIETSKEPVQEALPIVNNKVEQYEIFNLDKLKEDCIEIVLSYKSLYVNAEMIDQQYISWENLISQDDIDKIENFLIAGGYPVINSDKKYPSYLENSSGFYQFYNDSKNGKEVEQIIISITNDGGLLYSILKNTNGKKYQAIVIAKWNEENEPYIHDAEYHEINDWELINNTDFYYLTPLKGPMYDVYAYIRLKEVDKSLYDMNEKYILPIGYIFNNMFITDWESPNYDGLYLNDLLEPFYKKKYNKYFWAEDYQKTSEEYEYFYIPASLFENTIMPYFDITLVKFREKCLYNKVLNSYPWQEIGGENFSSYPNVEPEVVKYQKNDDGTISLFVDVRCYEYKTSRLFSHEVKIRPIDNEQYQYLSNKIIYKSEYDLPLNQSRIHMLIR